MPANYGVLSTSVEWLVYCMGNDILPPYIGRYRSPQVTSYDGLHDFHNATYTHSLAGKHKYNPPRFADEM